MIQNHNCKIGELLIIRMTKAYITTICNNEMRNALIEENICSVPQNSHIKRPPLGVGEVRACVERWSAFR